jgi:hypothetical protein
LGTNKEALVGVRGDQVRDDGLDACGAKHSLRNSRIVGWKEMRGLLEEEEGRSTWG